MKKRLLLGCLIALFVAPALAETLEEAMADAYRSNPALQAQRAQLRAMDEQSSQAVSGWRPHINGMASVGKLYTHTPNNPMMPEDGAHTPRTAGIEVVQPIFSGFRTVNGIDAADKQIMAGRAMLKAAEQQLLLNVGQAYLDVLRDRALVDLYTHNREVLDLRAQETKKRFSLGEVTQTDVLQAEARREGTKTGLIQAEGRLQSDTAAYLRYVGKPPKDLREPNLATSMPGTLSEIVETSIRKNPIVLAATYGEDAAKANIDINKGALLPQLDLVGSAGRGLDQSDFIPGRQDYSQIMLRLTVPLYNAGTEYSQTRAAQQTASQKRLELEDARLAIRQLAIDSWNGLQTARSATISSKAQVDADVQALEGVKKEAGLGTRTTLDILNAEQELLAARVNYIQARHDEAVAVLRIKAAEGTLTAEALKLPVEIYRPEANYEDVKTKAIGFAPGEE
ncbi:MAG: TolC family outer membrane protein [Alphaproteobacteria bacterium]|nr:TolC family outer membrane protein [Alphaproteobacteria bacterium]